MSGMSMSGSKPGDKKLAMPHRPSDRRLKLNA